MRALTLPRPVLPAVPSLLRLGAVPLRAVLAGLVLLFGLSLYAIAAFSLTAGSNDPAVPQAAARAVLAGVVSPVAPESDPNALAPISAEDAQKANAEIPVASGPNPAAAAFRLTNDEVARMRSIDCLTAAIYYEAALEPVDGQRAVAQVVLNRVRHPAYPSTVCGVVFQGHQRITGCQFSFTCDGSLRRTPVPSIWNRVKAIAEAALNGYVHRPVGLATHYHANYVFPYWAPTLAKITQIGAHIFYRWQGGWGRPAAFTSRYAGAEPAIAWRGGFGQPDRAALAAAAGAPVDARDAAAAAAAAEAQSANGGHSVDSFQRAVLRRYEPTSRERASQVLQDRAAAQPASSTNRWALTGRPSPDAQQQRPLGRAAAIPELDGVRRRPTTSEAAPAAQPSATTAPATETR
ncbi:MAG: cell wall hydrolase [Allosphingosinicella sp.]|uniref:cell wall hydrolase n=1 Tax=Allosphingosinicella sp. TaxID=2823234 RepID=UPI00394A09D3